MGKVIKSIFNQRDIAGFCHHLRCIQAALESGYEQAV
ncbi:MAG: hypothetical protein ACI9FJ_001506 [Alteromonadaceae bacterium]|jgi:hypothetical protein